MADRHNGPPLSVRLVPEDHDWLATFAKHEGVSVYALVNHAVWHFRSWQEKGRSALKDLLSCIDDMCRAYDDELRRQYYIRRAHERQLRRQYRMCRTYEDELRRERQLRRKYQKEVWRQRYIYHEYERELWRQRDYYERQMGTVRRALAEVPYSPKVAKLLALAVSSNSDAEARAAFAKARTRHRLAAR